jgi:uncharacterized protein
MTLHPVLEEKLNKAHAVTGMRRSGKTTFLRQLAAERQSGAPFERAVYISFDDDRLAEIKVDQLSALLAHLIDSYLISTVPLHTASERQRNSNPRKVYPADPGLIHAFDLQGRANLGQALETAVFNELQRRGAEVEYLKTADGFEVDFHVRHRAGGRAMLQVCADPTAQQTRAREIRALGLALKENPKVPAALLVLTQEQAVALAPAPFRIVPAYEWMLE